MLDNQSAAQYFDQTMLNGNLMQQSGLMPPPSNETPCNSAAALCHSSSGIGIDYSNGYEESHSSSILNDSQFGKIEIFECIVCLSLIGRGFRRERRS